MQQPYKDGMHFANRKGDLIQTRPVDATIKTKERLPPFHLVCFQGH